MTDEHKQAAQALTNLLDALHYIRMNKGCVIEEDTIHFKDMPARIKIAMDILEREILSIAIPNKTSFDDAESATPLPAERIACDQEIEIRHRAFCDSALHKMLNNHLGKEYVQNFVIGRQKH